MKKRGAGFVAVGIAQKSKRGVSNDEFVGAALVLHDRLNLDRNGPVGEVALAVGLLGLGLDVAGGILARQRRHSGRPSRRPLMLAKSRQP